MPIPYKFNPGEIAASSEVNANFEYIMGILGSSSSPARMLPSADIVLGPRSNFQISASADSAANSTKSYGHIGWNAELYLVGSTWKLRRFHDGEPAHFVRLGKAGIGFYSSSRTTGDLNTQATLMANIGATQSNGDRDWFFVRDSFTTSNASPTEHEDIRSTYVPFTTPKTVYEGSNIGVATLHRLAANYGVPEQACAIQLSFEAKAGGSDATILFTRTMNSLHQKYGFKVCQKSNTVAAGSGIVTLGMSGSHTGKFSEVRSQSWTSASLYILGYYI